MEFLIGMIVGATFAWCLFAWILKEMKDDNDYWYENSEKWMRAYFEKDNLDADS